MRETDCGAQIRFFCHVKAPKSQETPTKHLKYLNKIFQPRFKLPNNINIEVRGVTFQKFSQCYFESLLYSHLYVPAILEDETTTILDHHLFIHDNL